MAKFRSFAITAISLSLSLGGASVRADDPTPAPAPSDQIHLNPDSLRTLMIQNSPVLITELDSVIQAKDQARASLDALIPGISIGTVSSVSTPLSLAISAITFAAPFLVPSNWIGYSASKHNLDAQKLGYKITELNTYSSIYSLYETMIEQQNLLTMLAGEYQDWQDMYLLLQRQYNITGALAQQDLKTAQSQASAAQGAMDNMQQNYDANLAQMRYLLGLSKDTRTIVVDPLEVTASQYENTPVSQASQKSTDISPEGQQLKDLIAAGKNAAWSDAFAWMNGGTSVRAGNPYGSGGSSIPDIGSATINSSFSFGMGTVLMVQLDNDKTKAIQHSLDLLLNGQIKTLETAIVGLQDGLQELSADQTAEDSAHDVYTIERRSYNLGAASLQNVLVDFNAAQAASIARIQSQFNVDSLRIAIKRAMLEDEFSKLPGCQPAASAPSKNVFSKIGDGIVDIFSGAKSTQTLDQYCKSGV